jgi:SAM-dependent methyltransferase
VSKTYDACPACGGDDCDPLELIALEQQHRLYAGADDRLSAEMTASARGRVESYRMVACRRCGLQYAEPLVNPGSNWYGLAYRALSLYPEHRWEFDRVIESLGIGDRVAELGCGSGRFMSACVLSGVPCKGFDFSPAAVSACNELGLTAELLDLSRCDSFVNSRESHFTKVVAFHVLEHLDDPAWFFRAAAASTVSNAEVLVSVPSDRRTSRVYGEADFLDQPPHHLTRWTRESLERVGLPAGWQLRELKYEPLTLRVELWARAIRHPMYLRLARDQFPRWLERMIRFWFYPNAALERAFSARVLSGFSMLARYTKVEMVDSNGVDQSYVLSGVRTASAEPREILHQHL